MLLTRAVPNTGDTEAALRIRGFRPVVAPMLRIAVTPWSIVPGARPPRAVLVTSGNALAAAAPFAGRAPLFAVGDATADRARAAGWGEVESAGGDARSLAALVCARLAPGPGAILFPCGAGQGGQLAAALRDAGFTVTRRIAYRQIAATNWPDAATAAIKDGLHSAIFLSRSAALAFRRLLPAVLAPRLHTAHALAISVDAARPVAALPWRELRVALRPNAKDVLTLL